MRIPAAALPTRKPGERAAEYRRRATSRYICPCEECCRLQPWRREYKKWNSSRLKKGALGGL